MTHDNSNTSQGKVYINNNLEQTSQLVMLVLLEDFMLVTGTLVGQW